MVANPLTRPSRNTFGLKFQLLNQRLKKIPDMETINGIYLFSMNSIEFLIMKPIHIQLIITIGIKRLFKQNLRPAFLSPPKHFSTSSNIFILDFRKTYEYNNILLFERVRICFLLKGESMNVKEFAKIHNQQLVTVSTYIKRHKELFEGHIKKIGSNIDLDDDAIKILEVKYPLPEPIVLTPLDETHKKYIESLEQINYLQNTIINLQNKLQETNSIKLLFEKQENELEKLKEKYEKLKNRGLWDRIVNKEI